MQEPRESGELIPATVEIDLGLLRKAMLVAAATTCLVLTIESQGAPDYVEDVHSPHIPVTISTDAGHLTTEFRLNTICMGPLDPFAVILVTNAESSKALAELLGREENRNFGYDFYVAMLNPKITDASLGGDTIIHQIACVKDYGVDYTRRPMTALGMLLTSMT